MLGISEKIFCHRNRVIIIGLIVIPALLACGVLNNYPSQPSKSPNSILEGTWVPVDDTLSLIQQLGYKFSTHRLEFKSDGTFVMVNIPAVFINSQNASKVDFYSGNGTWTLSNKLLPNMGDPQPLVNLSTSANQNVVIQFGTILDNLYFYPDNKPTNETHIRFQKCQPFLRVIDPALKPLIVALNASKRDSLGFSPITKNDLIEVDGSIGSGDVWMNVYNDLSSHDISLRFQNNSYIWVLEQEIFYGPEKWVDYDGGQEQEEITAQYQTEEIIGGSVNKLMIMYLGHDPRLINRTMNWYLSKNISVVQPILEEWKQWRNTQPPSSESLCP